MSDKYAHLRPRRERHCYRADLVPKKRYTRIEAHRAAGKRLGYEAYRCPGCGWWHVGAARQEVT